ncbi:4,5-DOPA dioxygenase extradiol [Herbaspirillum sp. GCM10030257]|uniref:4,5-DOPA-extradiol-dioxygenase n=1 Tax=Herbaspirillum sp. GCM10030257 TaxID=3273393 RepID=UPI00361D95AA
MTNTSHIRMPAIFFGHGSPMNALDDNAYTRAWEQIGLNMPRPRAIVAVSAHWYTKGTAVTAMEYPPTIHDFGGFPQELFDIRYPAPGDPALARRIQSLLSPVPVQLDTEWGLDHGTWSVLVKAFPKADIPVVQLSIDATQPNAFHLELGRRLSVLRDEGVLLMASGDVVHNLRTMRRGTTQGYDWAERFNTQVRDALMQGDNDKLVDYAAWGDDAALSVPTPEHFLPLLYIAGARRDDEDVSIAVDGMDLGSVSMLTAVVGKAA